MVFSTDISFSMHILVYQLLGMQSLDACALVYGRTGKYLLIPEKSVRIYRSCTCDCFLLGGKYDMNATESLNLYLSIKK